MRLFKLSRREDALDGDVNKEKEMRFAFVDNSDLMTAKENP